jgi:putative phage-type endonuclease
MSYIEIDAEQRSPEWFAARLAVFTASDAPAMCDFTQAGKAGAKRKSLLTRLVCERVTGRSAEDPFTNGDMERGIALEAQARIAYEFQTGVAVRNVGFLKSTTDAAGCSPDGVVGDMEGLVEIKCPRSPRHLTFIRDGKVPTDYLPQLQHQLWIAGAGWVDFVSFDPLMPERLQLFVVRLTREAAKVDDYAVKARAFLDEVEREYLALQTMSNPVAQLRAVVA